MKTKKKYVSYIRVRIKIPVYTKVVRLRYKTNLVANGQCIQDDDRARNKKEKLSSTLNGYESY